jgi:hypothetical protein
LAAARFHVADELGNIRFPDGSAIEAFADFRAKGRKLGLADALAFLDEAEAVANDLAGGAVAPTLQQALNESLEV